MTTLFDVVQRTFQELGNVVGGTATGGSTTTLIDTLVLDEYEDLFFDEGTLMVVYDAGGAAAAPQGEYGVVSNFDGATNTVTLSAAMTAAIASGDQYLLATARFPLWQVREAVNRALGETGNVEVVDSSLTATAAQTEYSLPAKNITVVKVEYNTKVGDSDDLQLAEITGWHVRKTASGSVDTLVFNTQPPVSRTLYVTYLGKHPRVSLSSDAIDDRLDVNALSLRAAILVCEYKLFEDAADPQIKMQLDSLKERYAEVRTLQEPMPRPRRGTFTARHGLARGRWEDEFQTPS